MIKVEHINDTSKFCIIPTNCLVCNFIESNKCTAKKIDFEKLKEIEVIELKCFLHNRNEEKGEKE